MTVRDDDVTAARRAVAALEKAAEGVCKHYGDTVDVRRLLADVGRLGDDLDLLCGKPVAPPPVQREVIPDTEYDPNLWVGVDDEGLGATGRPLR